MKTSPPGRTTRSISRPSTPGSGDVLHDVARQHDVDAPVGEGEVLPARGDRVGALAALLGVHVDVETDVPGPRRAEGPGELRAARTPRRRTVAPRERPVLEDLGDGVGGELAVEHVGLGLLLEE